jgi:hypothetical protein
LATVLKILPSILASSLRLDERVLVSTVSVETQPFVPPGHRAGLSFFRDPDERHTDLPDGRTHVLGRQASELGEHHRASSFGGFKLKISGGQRIAGLLRSINQANAPLIPFG